MKLIKLTQGKFAQVDNENFEKLNKYKWFAQKNRNTFYAQRSIRINGKQIMIYMHRIIINTPPGMTTDHRDGNGLNNQRENLRTATSQENQRNRTGPQCNNRLGIKGVCWHKAGKKFEARIQVDGKAIHLGVFFCLEKAKKVRLEAELKYFGKFAPRQTSSINDIHILPRNRIQEPLLTNTNTTEKHEHINYN